MINWAEIQIWNIRQCKCLPLFLFDYFDFSQFNRLQVYTCLGHHFRSDGSLQEHKIESRNAMSSFGRAASATYILLCDGHCLGAADDGAARSRTRAARDEEQQHQSCGGSVEVFNWNHNHANQKDGNKDKT